MKIQQSKILRYPYKSLLGMSLTRYILDCRDESLDSIQTILKIMGEPSIIMYLKLHPMESIKFGENVTTSVSARYSEEKSRGR
jgi:hypothetical protein